MTKKYTACVIATYELNSIETCWRYMGFHWDTFEQAQDDGLLAFARIRPKLPKQISVDFNIIEHEEE